VSTRAVKNALLSRLREDASLKSIVHEGVVTDRPSRYVTVYADTGRRSAGRLTGPQTTATQYFTVHSVGTTPDKAQEVAERVITQLCDHVLLVEGRDCWPVTHEESQPAALDADSNPPLHYCIDEFEVVSTPTA
jgi:hypothetical protein